MSTVTTSNHPRVDRWLDLLDRTLWTAIEAAAAALLTWWVTDGIGWEEALIFIGTATVLAVAKTIAGQRSGQDETGSLIGQPVVTPPPKAEPVTYATKPKKR
jgi:hypothetical protein